MFNFRNLFNSPANQIIDNIKQQGYPNAPEPLAEPERSYYSLSPTTQGRVMLRVHYGNISMDEKGIDGLIKVLEASKVWLEPEKEKVEEENNE